MSDLIYRMILPDEWEKLRPIFDQNGSPLPSIGFATAAICENGNGEIVGMLCLQYALHSEPLWIKEEARGRVSWRRLLGTITNLLSDTVGGTFYVFAPNKQIARMCEIARMEQKPWAVFEGKVGK